MEVLPDGSYRWYVLLEPEDIKSDPDNVYRLKESSQGAPKGDTPPVTDGMGMVTSMTGGGDKSGMTPMPSVTGGGEISSEPTKPSSTRVEDQIFDAQNESLKITLKDKESKIHQQERPLEVKESPAMDRNDDEPVGHKILLRKLQDIGMKQRVARKALREHDHQLVAQALESVARRQDVKNPAGYVIAELKDGGYNSEEWLESPGSALAGASRAEQKPVVKRSDAPIAYRSASQTKAESERLEAESLAKENRYREEFKALHRRFQGLTEDLKSKLKAHWTKHLEKMLPNTARKSAMMQEATFQRVAFKEVIERFFALVDEGLAPEGAFSRLAT